MTKREIGWALKREREGLAITQEEMAQKIRDAGHQVSDSAYHLAEKHGLMSPKLKQKLSTFLEEVASGT